MTALNQQMITEAASYIQSKSSIKPEVGLILGSGLGVLAELIEDGEYCLPGHPAFPGVHCRRT